MIAMRAVQVREHLAEVYRLRRAEGEASDIQDTLAELHGLHSALASFCDTYRRIAVHINEEAKQPLDAGFAQLISDTRILRDEFEQRSRQAVKLRPMVDRAIGLSRSLDAAWSSYANDESYRYAELLTLVDSLPEMQVRVGFLRQLRHRLHELASQAPASDAELAEFDDTLQQLRDELELIEGLTPEVLVFLQRVVSKTATLGDLSDDVLEWCRHGDRSHSFSLQFKVTR